MSIILTLLFTLCNVNIHPTHCTNKQEVSTFANLLVKWHLDSFVISCPGSIPCTYQTKKKKVSTFKAFYEICSNWSFIGKSEEALQEMDNYGCWVQESPPALHVCLVPTTKIPTVSLYAIVFFFGWWKYAIVFNCFHNKSNLLIVICRARV